MYVDEIYDEARAFCHLNDQSLVFRYLTDATTVLSNKGDFEILTNVITIPTNGTNIVTLPREVKTPLKVNLDGQPTFSRDRLYEFTMNSVGSDAERPSLSWEDMGTVATLRPIPLNQFVASAQLTPTSHSPGDNGLVTITGRDVNGEEISETLNISSITTQFFTSITRIKKPVTIDDMELYSVWVLGAPGTGNTLLSTYPPDETEPVYRQIRISDSGAAVRVLFKRHTFKITSMNDYIPVRSKRALLTMIKALRMYDAEDLKGGSGMEDLAVKWATDEQKSWQTFIELAGASETQPIRGLNINNRDSIIVADVFDDMARIFGPIGTPKLYDKMTEAEELLANKGQWDPRVGSVDIRTDQYYFVTLPRYVEEILALNICNQPTSFNNEWFEYHLNGPGANYTPCGSRTKVGEVVTFRDVNYSQKLVAIPDLSSDAGTVMRGYGRYQGKEIFTASASGVMERGFPIEVNMSGATSSNQFVDVIERITKAPSNGFIKLLGFDASRNLQNTIGYYWPDETEPKYIRYRLGVASAHVRIKYRKRVLKLSALTDPIHLGSKTAFVRMCQALKHLDDGRYQEAGVEEAIALKLLEEEQASSNPLSQPEVEFEESGFGSNYVC